MRYYNGKVRVEDTDCCDNCNKCYECQQQLSIINLLNLIPKEDVNVSVNIVSCNKRVKLVEE